MLNQQTERRGSRSALIEELKRAGAIEKGKMIICPFHDDKSPSMSLHDDGGVWRAYCHAASCKFKGDVFDVMSRASGKPVGDVLKAESGRDSASVSPAPKPKRVFSSAAEIERSVGSLGKVEAVYQYTKPRSVDVEIVQVRYVDSDGKKHFLTHHASDGGFVLGAPPKPWPIYNRTRVSESQTVVVVEGEKCVHALAKIGIVATTSLSGSSNADKANWSPLAGKRVVIWPDKDESGYAYADEVVRQLERLVPAADVSLVGVANLSALGEHGDVADLIERDGWAAEDFWAYANDSSESVGPAADLDARIASIQDGRFTNLPWPWRQLTSASRSLLNGTITVWCGDPSASKSILMLESLAFWNASGISAAVKMLEGTRADHLHRLLAIKAGNWDLLDPEWCIANPKALPLARTQFKAEIDAMSRCLCCDELGKVRYKDVIEWMEREVGAGRQILVVDPITAVQTGESRQVEDHEFIVQASSLLRRTGARLVLVTHPRSISGSSKGGMDEMAGGRAFSRHTDSVIWLSRHDPPEFYRCKDADGIERVELCNRSVKIAKARNSPGNGWRLGFHLGADVRFVEHGVVIGKASEPPDCVGHRQRVSNGAVDQQEFPYGK